MLAVLITLKLLSVELRIELEISKILYPAATLVSKQDPRS